MKHEFRLKAIGGNLFSIVSKELNIGSMTWDDRSWLAFEYDDETRKLGCYKNYIQDNNLIKVIDVEVSRFLPGYALGVVSYSDRAEIMWGTKEEVIAFRKKLAESI